MKTELLTQLYGIHSPTGDEWEMICFVRQWLAANVPEATERMDGLGNLYITKGEAESGYPTLACHLDQVQTLHSDDFEVRQEDDRLFGWSESNQRQEGLGADDKNGIFVCLRCLEECPHLKVFMAVGEEKGCIGSNRADMSFFADSLYVMEPDCAGGEGPRVVLRGIPCASEAFVEALPLEAYGYALTEGKTTDILALTFSDIGVSCINIPAGYHNPHKDDEYTLLPELERCMAFVKQVVTTLHRHFPHEYRSATQLRIMELKRSNYRLLTLMLLLLFAAGCNKSDEPDDGGGSNGDVPSEYVDLGLPSGILWATCNLGAETPEDCGDYFAWGDTVTKEVYDWKNYRYTHFVDGAYLLNKYCTDSYWGFNGFVDDLTVLEPSDDAAKATLGAGWRMPTKEDYAELFQNTTYAWTTQNGVEGRLLTGPNGNSIFLPATGFRLDGELLCPGLGLYWSSSLQTSSQMSAWSFHFDYEDCHVCGTYERCRGQVIRAVHDRE